MVKFKITLFDADCYHANVLYLNWSFTIFKVSQFLGVLF